MEEQAPAKGGSVPPLICKEAKRAFLVGLSLQGLGPRCAASWVLQIAVYNITLIFLVRCTVRTACVGFCVCTLLSYCRAAMTEVSVQYQQVAVGHHVAVASFLH